MATCQTLIVVLANIFMVFEMELSALSHCIILQWKLLAFPKICKTAKFTSAIMTIMQKLIYRFDNRSIKSWTEIKKFDWYLKEKDKTAKKILIITVGNCSPAINGHCRAIEAGTVCTMLMSRKNN